MSTLIYVTLLTISVILILVGSLLIALDPDKYGVAGAIIILIFFFAAAALLAMRLHSINNIFSNNIKI